MRCPLLATTCLAVLSIAPAPAAARPSGLKAALAPESVSLDGLPNEMDGEWRKLTYVQKGDEPSSADCSAQVLIAYDDEALWVAADVTDDDLVGGGDHVELVLGIPGGQTVSFALYPGVAGKSRASVKRNRIPVRGAEVVEAPSGGGYTLEAKIPWSAVPKSRTIRVGYRGAVFVHDADGSRSVGTVIGTADAKSYDELPPISMAAELSLGSGLLRKRNIQTPPEHNFLANVVGDELLERVLVYKSYLVILGPGYRDGQQYYFRDMGADASRGDLLTFEAKDFTGDRRDDLLVKKRVRGSKGSVEVMEILSYHPGGETPDAIFAQEVEIDLEEGKIVNDVEMTGWGGRTRIVVDAGKNDGIDPSRFERVSNTGASPVLLPWGSVASQTYGLRNGSFVVIDEQSQEPKVTKIPIRTPSRGKSSTKGASWQKSGGADVDAVYAHYKKQRNVRSRARFDLRANLAEGKEPERLVIHDRDLVVFGPGFRGGRGFAAVELASFEKASDVKKVTTRDVTGDGKDEILVEGLIHSPMPEDLGGGQMHREVIMIYKLEGGQFERVFAAELARNVGSKRVQARIAFSGSNKAIVLQPGRARGYDEGTYPWRQKMAPEGDFEPLLLPWGGVSQVKVTYDGKRFSR